MGDKEDMFIEAQNSPPKVTADVISDLNSIQMEEDEVIQVQSTEKEKIKKNEKAKKQVHFALEEEHIKNVLRRSPRRKPLSPLAVKKGGGKNTSKGKNAQIDKYRQNAREESCDEECKVVEEKGDDGEDDDSEDKSHHGNAMNAYVRFKNVMMHKLRKIDPDVRMTDDVKRTINIEWKSMSNSKKEPYLTGAAQEKQKRKLEGKMKRKPTGEKAKLKMKLAEDKMKGQSKKKLKNPRRFQSYMSLPSVITLFTDITDEQKSWLYIVGLGGLEFLKISETPEAFNQFIYNSFDTDGYLQAHGRSVEITPEVVGWLFGIRCTGTTEFPEIEQPELCKVQQRLGLVKEVTKLGEYVMWFKKEENKQLCNDEWKQRAVCLILGALGMPIGRQGVRRGLAKLVVDLEHLKEVNWAALWLDHFRTQQVKAQTGNTFRGTGCVLMPLLLYLEKFCPKFMQNPKLCQDKVESPRLRFWDTSDVSKRWKYVSQTKNLKLKSDEEKISEKVVANEIQLIPPPEYIWKEIVGELAEKFDPETVMDMFATAFKKRKAHSEVGMEDLKRMKKVEESKMEEDDEKQEDEGVKKGKKRNPTGKKAKK